MKEEKGRPKRSRFLLRSILRRRNQKRIPSFDATVASGESSSASQFELSQREEARRNCFVTPPAVSMFQVDSFSQNDSGGIEMEDSSSRQSPREEEIRQSPREQVRQSPREEDATVARDASERENANPLHRTSPIQIVEMDDDDDLYQDIALRSRMEALRLQEKMFGAGHPDVVFALQNLAQVCYRRGNIHQAQRVYDENRRQQTAATTTAIQDGPPTEVRIPHRNTSNTKPTK